MRLFALLVLMLAATAGAQVFKWTDSTGKTHYGDRPPEDVKAQEMRIRVPSYEGPVQVQDWGAVLRRRPAATPTGASVTMYSTDWCPHCKHARAYFAQKGVRFTDVDVEKSEAGHKEYEALGGKGVPIIVVGDKVMRGFSPEAFERLRKS